MMKRILILAYAVACYAVFIGTLLFAVGFIGNLLVPKTLDSGPVAALGVSLAIDLALIGVFALQHSGMARPAFKGWLARSIPAEACRSTYVLASATTLGLVMWLWAPLGGVVWDMGSAWAARVMTGLYFASWGLLLYATFLIDHFERFGLKQAVFALRGRDIPAPVFRTPALYRIVRHPIYSGLLGIFWCTPTMTVTHFVFAAITTLYILVGLRLEERDLERVHPEYGQYRHKVPALLPSPRRHLSRSADPENA